MNELDFYDYGGVANNRMMNVYNRFQSNYHKLLCVCSAGLLRSPTMAVYFSQGPWYCNTRAVGVTRLFALINIDYILCEWADTIVFSSVDERTFFFHAIDHRREFQEKCFALNLPDRFKYRDSILMDILDEQMNDPNYAEFRERITRSTGM